jgi:hypothetical protein
MRLHNDVQGFTIKKALKVLGVVVSLAVFCGGVWLAYAVYDNNRVMSNAVWISVPATITYTYSFYLQGGKTSSNFLAHYLVHASYKYTASDGEIHGGNDYQTITAPPFSPALSNNPKTEMGVVYYDQNDPNISYTFAPNSGLNMVASAFLAIIMVVVGAALLHSNLKLQ